MKRHQSINKIRNRINAELEAEKRQVKSAFGGITIGTVVKTDDPQEMGRIKVFCPSLGDRIDSPVDDLPWCMYSSPLAGFTSYGKRGNEDSTIDGLTAYGMWGIPKIGASVLVSVIDSNADYRVWMGCVFSQYTAHTMPHGRFFDNKDDDRIKSNNEGPFSSNEKPIEPLYTNQKLAFGEREGNHEWQSRGMDNQTSSINTVTVKQTLSKNIDDDNKGYSTNKSFPEYATKENTIYSLTTPGFHSMSMDDKAENCRIKLRTTSGHMILMDDTNERIYIATAKGENWIELDQAGNIDMYTSGNFSVHSEKDINLTSDQSIKMYSKDDLHIKSEKKIKIQSDQDFNIKSNANINIKSLAATDIHTVGNFMLQSDGTFDLLSSSTLRINTNDTCYMKSSLNTFINGSQLFLNSSVSGNAVSPYSSNFVETAHGTSKVPEHEPWGRIAILKDNPTSESIYNTNTLQGLGTSIDSSILELPYDDENVGKIERGINISRNKNWKR